MQQDAGNDIYYFFIKDFVGEDLQTPTSVHYLTITILNPILVMCGNAPDILFSCC